MVRQYRVRGLVSQIRADQTAFKIVQDLFPKGIQTQDLEKLTRDLYWIDELRIRMRNG